MNRGQALVWLTEQAFTEIITQYGPDGAEPRPYHDIMHTFWVHGMAGQLGRLAQSRGLITPEQADLLLIAAAYHDVVYHNGDGDDDNEQLSAETAAQNMRLAKAFTQAEIAETAEIIMATKVKSFESDRIIQSAEDSTYPGKLLADADLSSFGAPMQVYWNSAMRFFEETFPGVEFEGKPARDFLERQIRVVGAHQYFTDEGRQLFSHQQENVAFLAKMLERL